MHVWCVYFNKLIDNEDCKVPSFLTHRVSPVSCYAPRTLELLATDFRRATYAFAARETVITSRAAPPSCSSGWRAPAAAAMPGSFPVVASSSVVQLSAVLGTAAAPARSTVNASITARPASSNGHWMDGQAIAWRRVAKQQETVDSSQVYNATDGQTERDRETNTSSTNTLSSSIRM